MGWLLNGVPWEGKPSELLGTVVEAIPDLKYWSADALERLYTGVLEASVEVAEVDRESLHGAKRGAMTQYIHRTQEEIVKAGDHFKDRVGCLEYIYSRVLASEGMPDLA